MKVLITGKMGQLAQALVAGAPDFVELVVFGKDMLDISNPRLVEEVVLSEAPDLLVNAAAYTSVDLAEANVSIAHAVNGLGPENLAKACRKVGVRLFHISTDFVFDGGKSSPYEPSDTPNPLSVYARSKLAGEQAVVDILPASSVVVRTAWVYSSLGNNFVNSMLRLMKERKELGVVYDQIGTPTWVRSLARWIWVMSKKDSNGLFHWTDAGVASWYDFAIAIQELALVKGILAREIPIRPILSKDFPLAATRPYYSVLAKEAAEKASDLKTIHWKTQLSAMLDEMV